MARSEARREPMIRAIDAPPEWADWPDSRVHCRTCRNKSGYMCVSLKVSCNASDMPFYCESYSPKRTR